MIRVSLNSLATFCGGATYGALKLLPFWDPLRGDPRFEKLCQPEAKASHGQKPSPKEQSASIRVIAPEPMHVLILSERPWKRM
jgi:hypothetical protein